MKPAQGTLHKKRNRQGHGHGKARHKHSSGNGLVRWYLGGYQIRLRSLREERIKPEMFSSIQEAFASIRFFK